MWWASLSWEAIGNCFSTFDSTWSCCGQARALNNKHPLFFGFLPIFIVVVIACTCSAVTGDGVTGSARQPNLVLVQQSSHAWCMVYVSRCFFVFDLVARLFSVCFVVDPMFVGGDLGYEFGWSAWGFLFRVPSGSWWHMLCLRQGNWKSCDNNCHHGMSIIMILMMPSQRSCSICRRGPLVVGAALEIFLCESKKLLLVSRTQEINKKHKLAAHTE